MGKIPEVSIITIVKNDGLGLRKTLQSLLIQDFMDWQCKIVYGESQDSTFEVIQKFIASDSRITFVNESIGGIYSAMNDGIVTTNSKFLVFMNSGDTFANYDSLITLWSRIKESDLDLVIGNFVVDQENTPREVGREENFNKKKFAFNRNWGKHQSMIFRRIGEVVLYNSEYKIAADFDFVLRYLEKQNGLRISDVIARIESGGFSDVSLINGHLEKFIIRRERLLGLRNRTLNYFWTLAAVTKISIRKIRKRLLLS